MMNVPLDDETLAALFAGKRLVAVTDAGGQVVGYFAPALTQAEMARRYFGLPDPEELRRQRDGEEKTYTTAQVKEYLRSLEKRG